jgi:DNA-binding MarR family transcriptional regulator
LAYVGLLFGISQRADDLLIDLVADIRLALPGNHFLEARALLNGDRRTGLPIASRRAFKRVLATIKTIALVHQKQRSRDEMGNVVAEYSDYALAHQLIGDSFRESIGECQRYSDDRIRFIEKEGQMTPRALSEKTGVSTAAISQWIKPLIEKGVLYWCDDKGLGFMNFADLEKSKRSGRAYLMVAGGKRLPTVFELSMDSRWDKNGDLYSAYDLYLNGDEGEQEFYQGEETVGGQDIIFDDDSVTSEIKSAVKVLSEKSHAEVLRIVDDFRNSEMAKDSIDAANINLSNEFADILSMDHSEMVN